MKIYGLSGKSGTGKSYQAMNICKVEDIEGIIDDGLFIFQNTIQAGKSAKREETKIGAVKAALFTNEELRDEVASKIREVMPGSLLIIGTSDEMINRIADKLGLPKVEKMFHIEDLASEEEMLKAQKQRKEKGKHVIPVPTFELKPQFSGYFLAPIRRFKVRNGKKDYYEKSVVRPTYSYLGNFIISDRVIIDVVNHTAIRQEEVFQVHKVSTQSRDDGIIINLSVILRYGIYVFAAAENLQRIIAKKVELMTSINILAINIEVKGLKA